MSRGAESFEDFGVGQGRGPAIGGEDGGVEVVVELAPDGDEALVVRCATQVPGVTI
jgi:hypothetical protein